MNFNKLGLVVLSTGAIFMATSCNKGDPKVTEEEFNKVLSFKDVDYVQMKTEGEDNSSAEFQGTITLTKSSALETRKMAPGVCYFVTNNSVTEDGKDSTTYGEVYSTLDDKTISYVERYGTTKKDAGDFKSGTIGIDDEESRMYYTTPADLGARFKDYLYSDFEYKNGAYTASYVISPEPPEGANEEGEMSISISLYFLNKKLVKLKAVSSMHYEMFGAKIDSESEEVIKLTYNKLTPTNPKK